jgi:hypothetical protein
MTKYSLLAIMFSLINYSCENSNSFEIKSNVSKSQFAELSSLNQYRGYGISGVISIDISLLEFGIKYEAKGDNKNSASCEILITKSGNKNIIRTIEMSRSKLFSKIFTHKVSERILEDSELKEIFKRFKDCEELPINVSAENPCMHDTYYSIQIKNKESYWTTKWCSNHTFRYSQEFADYKKKIQYFENLLLDLGGVSPTKKMIVIDDIPNNDSLRIQAYPTYGLRILNAKYEFDNDSMRKDRDGIGEITLHPRDTLNLKKRLKVYEIRKDRSIHEILDE